MSSQAMMHARLRATATMGLRTREQVERAIDRPHAVGSALPYGPTWLWGIGFAGANVTIYPGRIRIGSAVYKTGTTPTIIEITADHAKIVWQCNSLTNVLSAELWTLPGDVKDHDNCMVGELYEIGWKEIAGDTPSHVTWMRQDLIHGVAYPGTF
ncbi:MAG: hypothetical protein PHR35_05905 [Kiritimatiellae bacterium]|nr:hypothetical protein [Kiritimatiellia bacterium]